MLEEPHSYDPPKFTIENGYILYLYSFCVGKFLNGYLGLYDIGEVVGNRSRDMTNCMHITVEDPPATFERLLKLETAVPMCPHKGIDAGSQVYKFDTRTSRYYLRAGISALGFNSCRDHRLPRGLTFLVPDRRPISGSVPLCNQPNSAG
jgi:hypothetical protein